MMSSTLIGFLADSECRGISSFGRREEALYSYLVTAQSIYVQLSSVQFFPERGANKRLRSQKRHSGHIPPVSEAKRKDHHFSSPGFTSIASICRSKQILYIKYRIEIQQKEIRSTSSIRRLSCWFSAHH